MGTVTQKIHGGVSDTFYSCINYKRSSALLHMLIVILMEQQGYLDKLSIFSCNIRKHIFSWSQMGLM